jgi:hypothetical protein
MDSSRLESKLREWAVQNASDSDTYIKIDFSGEIDASLSFEENVKLLQEKFPGTFQSVELRTAPKQLIMPQWLINKVENQEKACTYRPKSLKPGDCYYLVPTRFQGRNKAKIVVRVVEVEAVEDPKMLTDEEARWTGLQSKDELFYWFKKWYSKRYPPDGRSAIKFRNWFVVQNTN